MKNIFALIGMPGSGKSTASKIVADMGVVRCSVGEELRRLSLVGSDGTLSNIEQIKSIIDDFILNDERSYLIDGFPRSKEQMDFLIEKSREFRVIIIIFETSSDIAINRLSDRAACNRCGSIVKLGSRCCNIQSEQREDDANIIAIKNRFNIYKDNLNQIMNIAHKNNLPVHTINASKNQNLVFQDFQAIIQKYIV